MSNDSSKAAGDSPKVGSRFPSPLAPRPSPLALLSVSDLCVDLGGHEVLRGVSLDLPAGATLALVGESGSGKTTLLRALMGLLPSGAAVRGRVVWSGDGPSADLAYGSARQWRGVRGRQIAWIPQEPAAALDPRQTAGAHLRECLRSHGRVPRAAAWAQADGWLEQVGLSPARADEYPFQWSGGMQQRLLVAMALAQRPQLLLADEPTSALDMLHQARLLELLAEVRRRYGVAMILVTHDLAVAALAAEAVAVLQAGRIVETGAARQVLCHPRQAYTAAMVAHQPRLARGSGA